MAKKETKNAAISVYLTEEQKAQVHYIAQKNGKSDSQYLLDCGLATNIDTAKADFYNSINMDLIYLKRTTYVLTKLVVWELSNQNINHDEIKRFYHGMMTEAETLFK